jgi:hypothetical protein
LDFPLPKYGNYERRNTLASENLIHPKIKSAKQNLVPTSLG